LLGDADDLSMFSRVTSSFLCGSRLAPFAFFPHALK
jgi:hypothetical protein